MNSDINIFNIDNFVNFNFFESLSDVYKKTFHDKINVCESKGYFLACKHGKNNKLIDAFTINNVTLNRQDIIVGKLSKYQKDIPMANLVFKSNLVKEELKWIKYFIDCVVKHLHTCESEDRKLTNHNSIRMSVGRAINMVEEVECALIHKEEMVLSNGLYISKLIIHICTEVSKLSGGRAFLAGSVMDMLISFRLINLIYLREVESNEYN